ncbi:MAG: phosphoadenylylsulfate reductase [Planctomycetota bacterium]|nr:MAG: phosphoadenylylsulfate reductase [Planctomycetota bacterium]
MSTLTPVINLAEAQAALAGAEPQAIIRYAIERAQGGAMVSTNFRPLEAVMLHMVTQVQADIPVLWVDHGYNTAETYRFAERLIEQLGLQIHLYLPRRSAAHREAVSGGIPALDDAEAHDAFTQEVKLEPFRRGLAELAPSVWFTALRREQTAFRAGMEVFGLEASGLVKVSPLLDWDEARMRAYLDEHGLPDEATYFDPTKVEGSRECGLHPHLFAGKGR